MPIHRRGFIAGVGTVAFSSASARGQQQTQRVIGFLSGASSNALVPSIHRGLKEAGFVEGQNLKVEYRWAETRYDRLPALARELVDLRVRAIVSFGANEATLAAKAATSTIPVVFSTAQDPVALGLVTSLSRPAGNVTGVTWMGADLIAKSVELIQELLPNVTEIGLLLNPTRTNAAGQARIVTDAASRFGKRIRVVHAANAEDIEPAFAILGRERVGALIVVAEPLFRDHLERILDFAARHAIPTTYSLPDFARAGGLMSYGSSLTDAYVQLGVYAGRVLNGTAPADLPVQQSAKVEFVLNMKTAKALGLNVPITLLGRADEVIE